MLAVVWATADPVLAGRPTASVSSEICLVVVIDETRKDQTCRI
jgi:hypothetical protein